MFMWIILAALAFGAVFDGLGAVKAIESLFTEKLGLSPLMILILMQLSFIAMGTFLDDTAMLVIVAPLYIPLVGALGFDLIWYGVLYTIIRFSDDSSARTCHGVSTNRTMATGNRLRKIKTVLKELAR